MQFVHVDRFSGDWALAGYAALVAQPAMRVKAPTSLSPHGDVGWLVRKVLVCQHLGDRPYILESSVWVFGPALRRQGCKGCSLSVFRHVKLSSINPCICWVIYTADNIIMGFHATTSGFLLFNLFLTTSHKLLLPETREYL